MPLNTQKTAIVTGAARGIGLATSKLFLKEGWRVAMVDQDAEELSAATADLDSVIALNLDIASPKNAQAMRRYTLSAFGHIDALVNNAGVADFTPIEDTTYERWCEVMATNLDGVFLCVQAAIPALKETQGAIVNIGSISGLRASTLRVAYGTSKAAVIHLTQQQAAGLGEFGVRVNSVAPGPVRTKLAAAVHIKTSLTLITMPFRSIATVPKRKSATSSCFCVRLKHPMSPVRFWLQMADSMRLGWDYRHFANDR